ncbi:hypothetical protein [Haloplanus sp. C73]|uniref:hypothetical protein n=1 Tax=Haloplanus sp. C73 TaxID=3421641 RepID=UPI003EBBE49C
MPKTHPELAAVVETLVEHGATYVAANTWSLVDEPAQLYYHLPAGVPDSQKEALATYLDEEVGHRPYERQVGTIRIGGQATPARVHFVHRNGLHLYRRIPVYIAEGMAGLDPVEIDDGVDNAREVVATEPDIPPRPNETVPLELVVERLADAGAVSVEMYHEPLVVGETAVDLRIPMVPAKGAPIVGPIDAVEVGDETYPLYTTLTMDGPYGSTPDWTALYVDDSVRGLNPISVKGGCEAGRDVIERAKEVDTVRELTRSQES